MTATKTLLTLLALAFLFAPACDSNNDVYRGSGSSGTYRDEAPIKHYYQGSFENY